MKSDSYKPATDLQPPTMRYVAPLLYLVYSLGVIVLIAASAYAVLLVLT